MEGAINSVQCSQEALEGRTSLAGGRFDEVVKSEASWSQLISEDSGFPSRTSTPPLSPPHSPSKESINGVEEQPLH